jgi:modulator of FtsH protease HflK
VPPLLIADWTPIVWPMNEGEKPRRGRKSDEGQQPETAGTEPSDKDVPTSNPWLPGADEAPQRRSARMEDILRSRGPAPGLPFKTSSAAMWLWAAVATASAWLLSSAVHNLGPDERGFVTTFGRYERPIGSGFTLTLPWPIQTVVRSDVGKDRSMPLFGSNAETLMLTSDGELIDLRADLRWRITDLRRFTFGQSDGETALRRLAESAVRAAVAEMTFDELRDEKRQPELQQRVTGRLQRVLDGWQSGIGVVSVKVTAANPPAKLASTFKEIDKAAQEARKNHEVALKYAASVRLDADQEAEEFDRAYELYRIAPAVTRERIYYATIERVLRNNPVVIGGSGPGAALPALPGSKPSTVKQGGQ